jgi:hypothetical protein
MWNSSTRVAFPDPGFSSTLALYQNGSDINFARQGQSMPNMSQGVTATCGEWVCVSFSERIAGNWVGSWNLTWQVLNAVGWQSPREASGTITGTLGQPVVTGGDAMWWYTPTDLAVTNCWIYAKLYLHDTATIGAQRDRVVTKVFACSP